MERSKNSKVLVGAVGLVLAALATVAVVFAYNRGVSDSWARVEGRVAAVANSIREKVDYVEKLKALYDEWDADKEIIDKEGIDKYVEDLKALMKETASEEMRSALGEYLNKWEELQSVYVEQDNEATMRAFEEIKKSAAVTGEKMQAVLDWKIKNAMNDLEQR